MKVIIYEHVCGGGFAGKPIPAGVLAEGFGMLREVVADFKAAGHEVTVLLDDRIAKLHPSIEALFVLPIYLPGEPLRFLKINATINDATYIIAPETDQTLQKLVESIEQIGKTSLNCTPKAIEAVANKATLYQKLTEMGFPTPKTLVFKCADTITHINQTMKQELTYPVVFKPADGAGCEGLSIVKETTQIQSALDKIKTLSNAPIFLVQQFIEGESASVSCISNGKRALALILNKQNVTLTEPNGTSSYNGGCTPLSHPKKKEALSLAEKVVDSFVGLRGYVGVDLVVVKEGAYVVDVNPRLTTSYVGLRKVAGFNVAEAVVDAVVQEKLPAKHESQGFACFSEIKSAPPTTATFQKVQSVESVISPPFPLDSNCDSYTLVIGEGESLTAAKQRLEEAKKNLLELLT